MSYIVFKFYFLIHMFFNIIFLTRFNIYLQVQKSCWFCREENVVKSLLWQ